MNFPFALAWFQTGSSVTCDPPVLDTDKDYVIIVDEDKLGEILLSLLDDGYSYDSTIKYPGTDFTSLRKGNINLIMTSSWDFYNKFQLATNLCKKLNVKMKHNRVAIFQAILYGKVE